MSVDAQKYLGGGSRHLGSTCGNARRQSLHSSTTIFASIRFLIHSIISTNLRNDGIKLAGSQLLFYLPRPVRYLTSHYIKIHYLELMPIRNPYVLFRVKRCHKLCDGCGA